MTETVDLLIEGKRIVICAGSGGVGKTTTAAAIATGLASRGMRVAVLTIDPARRLAQSLGLEELDDEARRVAPERFAGAGIEMRGELWAMMLDAKRTFDELVERYAPDPAARDRLLGNRIYAEISTAVSGSQEYMAMEKLNELHAEARYDALVLDTPPTRNALDFLDAPSRLSRFIDSRALGVLIRPGGRLLGRGSSVLFHALKRITGVDVMEDISEFFAAFADMAQGFRDRAAQVDALLSGPATAFLVVTSPQPHAIDEAIFFRRRLEERRLPFAGGSSIACTSVRAASTARFHAPSSRSCSGSSSGARSLAASRRWALWPTATAGAPDGSSAPWAGRRLCQSPTSMTTSTTSPGSPR